MQQTNKASLCESNQQTLKIYSIAEDRTIELTYIQNTFVTFSNKVKSIELAEAGLVDAAMNYSIPVLKKMEWSDFCDWMEEFSNQSAKQDWKVDRTPAIFPSVYQCDAETRQTGFVQYNSNWMAFDIDETATFEDMSSFLKSLDCPYILHTTTKHSIEKPRIRALIHTMDEVEPEDWPKLWANMDALIRSHFPDLPEVTDKVTRNLNRIFYVPQKWKNTPAQFECRKDGALLDTGAIIARFGIEPESDVKLGSYEPENMCQQRHQELTDAGIVLIPEYIIQRAYADGKTGRFFSLLIRTARRLIFLGYKIDPVELEKAALNVDSLLTGNVRPNSREEAQHAIQLAYSTWASENLEAGNNNLNPIVDDQYSELVTNFIDAECSAGKSFQTLQRIAREKGRYVFACDKIINIDQRRDEFLSILGSDASSWEVRDIYYNRKNPDGVEMDMSVVIQLNQMLQYLNDNSKFEKVVVFISHAALKIYQLWQDWSKFHLIIDEVPEITYTYSKNFEDTFDVFKRYVCVGEKNGSAYDLELTPAGIDAVMYNSQDSLIQTFFAILQQIYFNNTKVWVKQSEWDDPESNKLNFFSVFTPKSLEPFKSVLLLGDQCSEMTIWAPALTSQNWPFYDSLSPLRRMELNNGSTGPFQFIGAS